MNLTEYAKKMGTSKTTIYRKIADAGLNMASIRDTNGDLTDEGLSALSALLDGTATKRPISQRVDVPETRESGVNLVGKVAELERQLDETREELASAQARIMELLEQAAKREREAAEAWQRYADRQQQIEAQRLLTAPAKPGLWARIFGGRGKDGE